VKEKVQVQILGCSGGIGAGLKTTCFCVDETILIDAGTGLELLSLDQMVRLRHLFITHAHLDHICCLPLMMPSIYDRMQHPLHIHANEVVIKALREQIFNWTVWPDFTQLPTPETSLLRFHVFQAGETKTVEGLNMTAIEVSHPTPTQGYLVESEQGAFAFSGDATNSPDFWQRLAVVDNLQHVMVDVSFPSDHQQIADLSGHFTPAALKQDLDGWPAERAKPQLHISHLKPGFESSVMAECEKLFQDWSVRRLSSMDSLLIE
jgi:ribonuclease BN (tRNA processing enzyme)